MSNPLILNNNLSFLILSRSTMGKTYSLRRVPEVCRKAFHINADAKPLPFKCPPNLQSNTPAVATDTLGFLQAAVGSEQVDIIALDTITEAGANYVNEIVMNAEDTRDAWGQYQKFLKDVVTATKRSMKPVIMMAHEQAELNETTGIMDHSAPFQGGFKKIGIEAGFTTIVGCQVIQPSKLTQDMLNPLLNVTDEEAEEDLKYVFQTRKTKATMGVKYRSPAGMFEANELYIDNCAVHVLERLNDFHNY